MESQTFFILETRRLYATLTLFGKLTTGEANQGIKRWLRCNLENSNPPDKFNKTTNKKKIAKIGREQKWASSVSLLWHGTTKKIMTLIRISSSTSEQQTLP